jgi:hypothetical protein
LNLPYEHNFNPFSLKQYLICPPQLTAACYLPPDHTYVLSGTYVRRATPLADDGVLLEVPAYRWIRGIVDEISSVDREEEKYLTQV